MAGVSRTVVSVKPGKIEALRELGSSKSNLLSELDGIIGFGWAITGENEMTIFGVFDDVESAEAATSVTSEVFAEMASLLAAKPEREVFDGDWFSK